MHEQSLFWGTRKALKRMLVALAVVVAGGIVVFAITVNVAPVPIAQGVRALFKDPDYAASIYDVNRDEVWIERDVSYPSQFAQNVVDVYQPKEGTPKATILWVHGGAFVGGDKGDVVNYAISLADNGYNIFVMNYALAPEATYPTPIIQLGECIGYLLTHAEEYSIDFDAFCLAGDSAGAQIAGQYTAIETNPTFAANMGMEQRLGEGGIKALLLYCGPYDMAALEETASPLTSFFFDQIGWAYLGDRNWKDSEALAQASVADHVSSQYPPTYITDGNTGSFEPQAMTLLAKLEENGVVVQSRFFDEKNYVTRHEYQFLLDTDPAALTLTDSISFIENWVVKQCTDRSLPLSVPDCC